MAKSRAEMMELLANLSAEYAITPSDLRQLAIRPPT